MGDINVRQDSGEKLRRNFMKLLLDDVRALERMLEAIGSQPLLRHPSNFPHRARC